MNAIEDVKRLLARGHADAAKDLLLEMDDLGQSTAESQYLLGTIYHRVNQLKEAVDRFKRALQMDPNFTDAAISLSIIYNDTGHYQEGRQIFEQAEQSALQRKSSPTPSIVLAKEISTKHLELGNLYRNLQKLDEAVHEYLKAAQTDSSNLEARILYAKTQAQRGQLKIAKQELEKLVQDNPDSVPARVHLALLYFGMGNVVDAQIELQDALMKDPQNEQVKMYLEMTHQATESRV